MFIVKKAQFMARFVQDELPQDAELMRQWELEHGHERLPSGWWFLLAPISLWIGWGFVALLLDLVKWVFGF